MVLFNLLTLSLPLLTNDVQGRAIKMEHHHKTWAHMRIAERHPHNKTHMDMAAHNHKKNMTLSSRALNLTHPLNEADYLTNAGGAGNIVTDALNGISSVTGISLGGAGAVMGSSLGGADSTVLGVSTANNIVKEAPNGVSSITGSLLGSADGITGSSLGGAGDILGAGSLSGVTVGRVGVTGSLSGTGSLTGATGGLTDVTGGLTGADGTVPASGDGTSAGSILIDPSSGGFTEPTNPDGEDGDDSEDEGSSAGSPGSGNSGTFFCCSTAPGIQPTLAGLVANVNCPMTSVLTIVEFYNTCSSDSHRVICNPSQTGMADDGLLNSQCTDNVPIQIN